MEECEIGIGNGGGLWYHTILVRHRHPPVRTGDAAQQKK